MKYYIILLSNGSVTRRDQSLCGGQMSKQREALKLALDALDCIYSPLHVREINKVGAAMVAIREALAEPEQEPVAWTTMPCDGDWVFLSGKQNPNGKLDGKWHPLYLSPPARKPLTDEEIALIVSGIFSERNYWVKFARAIERAHGITND